MPSIQIKNVPVETHQLLRRRAAARHQSLQEYLLLMLTKQAREEPIEEWVERLSERARGSLTFEEAAAVVRADRDRH